MIHQWAARHGVSAKAVGELLRMLSPGAISSGVEGKAESSVQQKIRLATNTTGGILLRNNSGVWTDDRGIPVRYGLGNDSAKLNKKFKSSDLIGITPIMLGGKMAGIFTAIEVKQPGWRYKGSSREEAQLFFLNVVKARGGIAGFATDPADYYNLISEYIR